MLLEQKHLCEKNADCYLGLWWRECDKSALFVKALDYENTDKKMFNACISAIMCRYWNSIGKNVMISSNAYDEFDAYNWLIDATLYTLKYRPWTKPELRLYKDPNGPDKCMNSCLKSSRQGFYQWSNAKKRAAGYTSNSSLESVVDTSGEGALPLFEPFSTHDVSMDIRELVHKEFIKKRYIDSFIIDGVCNSDCIDITPSEKGPYTQFNKKKLCKHIRHLDDKYCAIFSDTYGLAEDEVKEAKNSCIKLTSEKIYRAMNETFTRLQKNSLFSGGVIQ